VDAEGRRQLRRRRLRVDVENPRVLWIGELRTSQREKRRAGDCGLILLTEHRVGGNEIDRADVGDGAGVNVGRSAIDASNNARRAKRSMSARNATFTTLVMKAMIVVGRSEIPQGNRWRKPSTLDVTVGA